jgi:hypothetical protein
VDIPALREAQAQDAAIAAIDGQMQRGEWQAARGAAGAVLERSKSVWHGALQLALVRLAFLEALDAVCAWRVAPATIARRPVPVVYVLSLAVGAAAKPSR